MRSASKRRGIEITSISRPIRASDFRDFDLILAMDDRNRGRVLSQLHCISTFSDFCPSQSYQKLCISLMFD